MSAFDSLLMSCPSATVLTIGAEPCAADRREHAEESRHHGERHFLGRNQVVQILHKAVENAAFAHLDFKAHHEVQGKE